MADAEKGSDLLHFEILGELVERVGLIGGMRREALTVTEDTLRGFCDRVSALPFESNDQARTRLDTHWAPCNQEREQHQGKEELTFSVRESTNEKGEESGHTKTHPPSMPRTTRRTVVKRRIGVLPPGRSQG